MLYDKRKRNLVMMTDTYNLGHQMMKKNTDYELSHIYNRERDMLLFGFSDNINYFFKDPITQDDIDEAKKYCSSIGINMPYKLFERVVDEFKGFPPLSITTLSEGTWVPKGSPFAQIWNTEEGFGELVTWWESLLLWGYFISSCATRSLEIYKYNQETTPNFYRFHNFGYRSMGQEDRAIQASTAWALFNPSSDDFHISRYIPIRTIPASAHKVVQNWDNEMDCMMHAINTASSLSTINKSPLSIPIDTFGSDQFIMTKLIPLARHAESKNVYLVFRPDSGHTLEFARTILIQCKLNRLDNVGIIIGDSINFVTAQLNDMVLRESGIDLHKVVWGIGSKFYEDLNRDYLGWAMKTAWSNGKPRMKFSDTPVKESIPGRIQVTYCTKEELKIKFDKNPNWDSTPYGYVSCYFHNKNTLNPTRFIPKLAEIKQRALKTIPAIDKRKLVIEQDILDTKEKLRKTYL